MRRMLDRQAQPQRLAWRHTFGGMGEQARFDLFGFDGGGGVLGGGRKASEQEQEGE
jgi:hypothetical protein